MASNSLTVTRLQSIDNQIYGKVSSDAYQTDEFLTYNTYKVYNATAKTGGGEIGLMEPFLYAIASENESNNFNILGANETICQELYCPHYYCSNLTNCNISTSHFTISYYLTYTFNWIWHCIGGIVKGSLATLIMANHAGKVAVSSIYTILQNSMK
ncbi:hypothetical protein RclHR1_10130001 [Rhizophagus clarus]|uniref:Uncharacterized protein n=1 Tax=Rhizophagus clarus TaxID=94130 RepID=A0A2Z6QSU4_9GLOM|nr:hypothetical protein RclHR1_10130001 [Rhizophagus clarus]